MPLVRAAVCPTPPMLVPEVAAGAAAELDDLRTACDRVVADLLAASAELVVTVTSGHGPSGAEIGRADLPLGSAIGLWLLGRVALPGTAVRSLPDVHSITVDHDDLPARCAAMGAELAAAPERVAVLVLGDGSACRSEKAPGYLDPRAEAFDAGVARALAGPDPTALLDIDAGLAEELLCAGRAPWQVLAGAVLADGRGWSADLHYDEAPYGVGYFVAAWAPAGT